MADGDHEDLLGPPPDAPQTGDGGHEELLGPPPAAGAPGASAVPQTKLGMAGQAIGEALDTPLRGTIPGMESFGTVDLAKAQSGLQSASDTAGKFYSDLGYPATGKAVQVGGRALAGLIPARMKDALFIAAAGPALEGAGAAGKAALSTEAGQAVAGAAKIVVKSGGDLLANVAGMVAGKDPEVIKALVNSPGAVWKKATELFSMAHQENLDNTLHEGMKTIGNKFGALEDQFAGYHGTPTAGMAPKVNLQGVYDINVKDMLSRGHRLPKDLTGIEPTVTHGRIGTDDPEYKDILSHLTNMKKKPEVDFGEALNLKRQIGRTIDYGVEGKNGVQELSGEAQRVLKGIQAGLNKELRSSLPAEIRPKWDEVNRVYSSALDAFAELRKQIVKQSPGQTENKLLQLIKDGRYDDEITRRAGALGDKVLKAFDDARDHVAARSVRRWIDAPSVAHFLGGAPRPVGYGASGVGAFKTAGAKLAGAAAENPRAAVILGKGILGGAQTPEIP